MGDLMPEHSKELRADRAVACVKALAGVKDPEKLMAAVRRLLAHDTKAEPEAAYVWSDLLQKVGDVRAALKEEQPQNGD
jgi:hypothetical protein